MSIWIPDGDGACTNLLKFALNEATFEHTMVAFVVSLGQPWNIMESLQKWTKILVDHVKKLNIPEAKRAEYLKNQYRAFQTYQDPDENLNLTSVKKGGSAPNATNKEAKSDAAVNDDIDDGVLVPLDPFILSKNIGLPITVIVTKVWKFGHN